MTRTEQRCSLGVLLDQLNRPPGVDIPGEASVAAERRAFVLPQIHALLVGAAGSAATVATTRAAALAAELRKMITAFDGCDGRVESSASHHVRH